MNLSQKEKMEIDEQLMLSLTFTCMLCHMCICTTHMNIQAHTSYGNTHTCTQWFYRICHKIEGNKSNIWDGVKHRTCNFKYCPWTIALKRKLLNEALNKIRDWIDLIIVSIKPLRNQKEEQRAPCLEYNSQVKKYVMKLTYWEEMLLINSS